MTMSPQSDDTVPVSLSRMPEKLLAEPNVRGCKSVETELPNQECCMCGDVGLKQELFRCRECQYRLQHTYCSHSYPTERSYLGVCNWCDREDLQSHNVTKVTKDRERLLESECDKPRMWRNELEMLLEAAAVATMATVPTDEQSEHLSISSGSDSVCKNTSSLGRKRPRRTPRNKSSHEGVKPVEGNVPKFKDLKLSSSVCSKRMGRRYKCIVDVY